MNRIKQLREERHLNQQGLALQLNTSQSTISFYETEDRLPDLKTCISIAEFFNVTLDYLAGRSNTRNPEMTNNLTQLESNIVAQLKQLDENEQKQVQAFIRGISAQ